MIFVMKLVSQGLCGKVSMMPAGVTNTPYMLLVTTSAHLISRGNNRHVKYDIKYQTIVLAYRNCNGISNSATI